MLPILFLGGTKNAFILLRIFFIFTFKTLYQVAVARMATLLAHLQLQALRELLLSLAGIAYILNVSVLQTVTNTNNHPISTTIPLEGWREGSKGCMPTLYNL